MKNLRIKIFGILMLTITAFLILSVNLTTNVTTQKEVTVNGNTVQVTETKCETLLVNGICNLLNQNQTLSVNQQQPSASFQLLPPETISLITKVKRTDDYGTVETFESKSDFPLPVGLGLITEQGKNLSFNNGIIELTLEMKLPKSQISIDGTGLLFVSLNGNNFYSEGKKISFVGTPDQDGIIKGTVPVSGQLFNEIFSFQANSNAINEGINDLNFTIQDITITKHETTGFDVQDKVFRLNEKTSVYAMKIERDLNQVIVKNEAGQLLRIYPSDDIVSLCGKSAFASYSYTPYRGVAGTITQRYPPPIIGTLTVYLVKDDGTQETIGQVSHTTQQDGCFSVDNIPRNTDISVTVSGFRSFTTNYHTLATQQANSYTCMNDHIKFVSQSEWDGVARSGGGASPYIYYNTIIGYCIFK